VIYLRTGFVRERRPLAKKKTPEPRDGRTTDFFQGPRLPHKCGVPVGFGTPHSCGSEEFCRAPTRLTFRRLAKPVRTAASLALLAVRTAIRLA